MPELRVSFVPVFDAAAMAGFAQGLQKEMKAAGASSGSSAPEQASGLVGALKADIASLQKAIEAASSKDELKELIKAQNARKGELNELLGKQKGFDIGAGGIAKIAGLGALAGGGTMAILEQLMESFKPLVAMVQQIGRVLIEFLRPIAEAIQYLLQPVLIALRPLLTVFNTIFAPYRQAASQLSREANQAMSEGGAEGIAKGTALAGLASLTALKPFQDILIRAAGEILKVAVDLGATMVKGIVTVMSQLAGLILDVLPGSLGDKARQLGIVTNDFIDAYAEVAKGGIDSAVNYIINFTNGVLQSMARALGSEAIYPIFEVGTAGSIGDQMSKAIANFGGDVTSVLDETFTGENGLNAAFVKQMRSFGQEARKVIEEEMSAAKRALKKGNSYAGKDYDWMDGGYSSASGGSVAPAVTSRNTAQSISKSFADVGFSISPGLRAKLERDLG